MALRGKIRRVYKSIAAKSIERSGKDLKTKSGISGKSENSKVPPSTSAIQAQDVRRVSEQKLQSIPVQQKQLEKSDQGRSQQSNTAFYTTEGNLTSRNDVSKPAGRLRFFMEELKKLTSDSRILE